MNDLIVNLYDNNYLEDNYLELTSSEYKVKRLLSPNSDDLISFVKENFTNTWTSEVKSAVYKNNPTCFIVTHNNAIVGFACYDATAKGYFGPTGVKDNYRGKNIGQTLLLKTLRAMKDDGYGYAIIGSVAKTVQGFYAKYIKFITVENNRNLYSRLLNR